MERSKQDGRGWLSGLGMGLVALGFGLLFLQLNGMRLPEASAQGEAYPAKKITWVCPVRAGGSMDMVARTTAFYLPKYLKEASKGAKGGDVVVENRSEAGGRRAYSAVYKAKPDGYTMGDLNPAFVAEELFTKMDIEVEKYTYLARFGASDRVVIARTEGGFKSWEEMMQAGKSKEIKWGASSFGRGHHVTSILMKEKLNLPVRLINFPGAVENENALIRGDIDVAMVAEEGAKPLVDAGKAKVLLVVGESAREYPGAKTLGEVGAPELVAPNLLEYVVIGPPDLPKDVTNILIAGLKGTYQDKEFLTQIKKLGFTPNPVYGQDAQNLAFKIFKFIENNADVLKKNLAPK
jgi:tripartite-type tricarboxylate transporter receptor subunit TctC